MTGQAPGTVTEPPTLSANLTDGAWYGYEAHTSRAT
jgi:hypothetical protein